MHNTHVHTDTPYVSGRPLQAFYLELELLSSMKKKSLMLCSFKFHSPPWKTFVQSDSVRSLAKKNEGKTCNSSSAMPSNEREREGETIMKTVLPTLQDSWSKARGCCCCGDQTKQGPRPPTLKELPDHPLYKTARVVTFLILWQSAFIKTIKYPTEQNI